MLPPRRAALLALLAVLALGPSAGRAGAEEGGARVAALLVAVGEYPFLARALGEERYRREVRLQGPAADAALLREVLVERLGVPAERVEVLAGAYEDPVAAPTRRNVLAALRRLARDARPGDTVLVALAGHGSQEPDASGDEANDEVFLAADARGLAAGERRIPGGISDDEFGERLRAIRDRGARVVFVADCCHAGTMARGGLAGARIRRLAPRTLGTAPADPWTARGGREEGRRLDGDLRGITALYAAGSDESAVEVSLPPGAREGRVHGAFTWALAAELVRSGGRAPWREVLARAAGTVRGLGVFGAHPEGEGDLEATLLAGEGTRPLDAPAWRLDDGVAIGAGALDGIAPGTALELVPARPDATRAPLRATVRHADPLRSVAGWDDPADAARAPPGEEAAPPMRARVVAWALPSPTLPLAFVDREGRAVPPSARPPDLLAAWDEEAVRAAFPLVADPAQAAWLLVLDGARAFLRPARLLSGEDAPWLADAERLPATLAQVARVDRLVRLARSPGAPGPPTGFEVVGGIAGGPGGTARETRLEDATAVRPGDGLRFLARNGTERPLDVHAFLLDADAGLTCVFPPADRSPRLAAGASAILVEGEVNDATLGEEHLLVVAVPVRADALPSDLRWLEAPPRARAGAERARGGERGGVGDLLAGAAFGGASPATAPRGGGPAEDGGLLLRTWRTTWEPVLPRAEPLVASRSVLASGRPTRGPWDPWAAPGSWRLERSEVAAAGYDLLRRSWDHGADLFVAAGAGVPQDAGDPAALTRLVEERAFPAAVVLSFGPGVRRVAYDRDADGAFDLVLEDRGGDPEAEVRHVLEGGRWSTEEGLRTPLLRLARLDPARHAEEALVRLTAVLRTVLSR